MEFKRCPNCRGIPFYVEPEPDKLIFFRITVAGDVVANQEPHDPVSLPATDTIHCVSCSWEGSASALVSGEN